MIKEKQLLRIWEEFGYKLQLTKEIKEALAYNRPFCISKKLVAVLDGERK